MPLRTTLSESSVQPQHTALCCEVLFCAPNFAECTQVLRSLRLGFKFRQETKLFKSFTEMVSFFFVLVYAVVVFILSLCCSRL